MTNPEGVTIFSGYGLTLRLLALTFAILFSTFALIRPDGMTIAMDSPAVDTVGRGGIPASVNTHFFQRLTGALLQSTVSLGASLAGRSTGSVFVLPGATAALPQVAPQTDIAPTLTVAPGKSISVFVAHDLDFSSAEAVR